jgi:hypothetical protein
MKNIISVIALAFTMLLGINTAGAQTLTQDQDRPEVIAKAKAAELNDILKLNDDQQRAVFRALVANEVGYRKNIVGQDQSSATVIAEKQKYDSVLKDAMKKTLTPEQYQKWLSLQNK